MAYVSGDKLRITYWCQAGSQAGLFIANYSVSGVGVSGLTSQQYADAISATMAVPIIGCMSGQAQYRGLIIYYRGITPLPVPVYSVAGADNGTRTGDVLPTQISGLFTQRTFLAGRTNRGRKYIPFPARDDLTASVPPTPTTGYMTALGILASYFLGVQTFDGPTPATQFIALQNVLAGVGAGADKLVESVVARPAWATQRRRGSLGASNIAPF